LTAAHRLRRAALALVCASLTACTQPPPPTPDCATADWHATGVGDGAAGRGHDRLTTHLEACGASLPPVDTDAWRAGHAEGLRAYCTPRHALDVGRRGRRMNPICPAPLRAKIAAANDGGFQEFWLMREIQDLYSESGAGWGHSRHSRFPGSIYEASMISARISNARSQLAWLRARNEDLVAQD
jgi:hypothetical protein